MWTRVRAVCVQNVCDRDLRVSSEAELCKYDSLGQTRPGSHWDTERDEINHNKLKVGLSRDYCWMAVRLTGFFSPHFKAHCELYCHLMSGRHMTIIAMSAFTQNILINKRTLLNFYATNSFLIRTDVQNTYWRQGWRINSDISEHWPTSITSPCLFLSVTAGNMNIHMNTSDYMAIMTFWDTLMVKIIKRKASNPFWL